MYLAKKAAVHLVVVCPSLVSRTPSDHDILAIKADRECMTPWLYSSESSVHVAYIFIFGQQ